MALTRSTMQEIGSLAPSFELPDVREGNLKSCNVSLQECKGEKGTLVIFLCAHCPFVVHMESFFPEMSRRLEKSGVKVVGISSNDVENYSADSPENLAKMAQKHSWDFPLLYDETQEVAKAYRAACTPDFFLYDGELKLFYRGQLDSSRPGNGKPLDGKDLYEAVEALAQGKASPEKQYPSAGCNIKWKRGNEPDYF